MNILPISDTFSTPDVSKQEKVISEESIFSSLNNTSAARESVQSTAKSVDEFKSLPEIAKDVLKKVNLDDKPEVKSVVSTVNKMFEAAPEITENSKTVNIREDGKNAVRTFEEADVVIDGILKHVIHGIEQFEDYTNENVEVFEYDENGEMHQTGGYGVLKYFEDNSVEIHYDDQFETKYLKDIDDFTEYPTKGYVTSYGPNGEVQYIRLEYHFDENSEDLIPEEKDYKEYE